MTAATLDTTTITRIEDDARRHAQQGIFWPPYARVAWLDANPDRHAAQEACSKAYWNRHNRLRSVQRRTWTVITINEFGPTSSVFVGPLRVN
jgi:hypothetical protein